MKIIRNLNILLATIYLNDFYVILSDGLLLLTFVLKLSKCILLKNALFQLKAKKKCLPLKEK